MPRLTTGSDGHDGFHVLLKFDPPQGLEDPLEERARDPSCASSSGAIAKVQGANMTQRAQTCSLLFLLCVVGRVGLVSLRVKAEVELFLSSFFSFFLFSSMCCESCWSTVLFHAQLHDDPNA